MYSSVIYTTAGTPNIRKTYTLSLSHVVFQECVFEDAHVCRYVVSIDSIVCVYYCCYMIYLTTLIIDGDGLRAETPL